MCRARGGARLRRNRAPRRRQLRASPPTPAPRRRQPRRWQALKQTASPHSLCSSLAQWFQMIKFRRKQVYPECFHEFCGFSKFLQIYITSVSGYLSFTFKTCQIVAGASMIHQFHEFFESHFWRVFAIWPSCASQPSLVVIVAALTQPRKSLQNS